MANSIVKLPLSRGYEALIDQDDFAAVGHYKWSVKIGSGELRYAQRSVAVDGKMTIVLLHRQLLGMTRSDGLYVDFKDGNGLNCTRENMLISDVPNRKPKKSWRRSEPNEIRTEGTDIIILLAGERVAVVDAADYPLVSAYRWVATQTENCFYAKATVYRDDGRRTSLMMHRLLFGLKAGDQTRPDHIDGNGLNNRRSNLRIATVSQNGMNKRKHKDTSSQYKGVRFRHETDRWQASIFVQGKHVALGCYETEREAAIAYNEAAKQYFGDRACLNLIV